MKEILLIRHGATAGNLERRYIGRTDEPLSGVGTAQIKTLRERQLAAEQVFVSPMLRARQTAAILFPGQDAVIVEDLRETDFGVFEGKTAQELAGDAAYQGWVDSWCRGSIPGGESKEEVAERAVVAFLQAVELVKEGASAAFVTHGGVIMSLMERFGKENADFYDYHVKNGGFLRCAWDGTHLIVTEKG